MLTDLRNRGVKDVFFLVCDGLKGLPEVVGNVWPQTIVQTCIIHLIRNTFRLASEAGLGRDQAGRETDLHRAERPRLPGPRSTSWPRRWGATVPGDHPTLGKRLGGVHPVPGLRRGDPQRDLLDERDRVA